MPSEPVTILTDYILALLALIIFSSFIKIKTHARGKRWIEFSYLFLACSAFLAGTWHGYHNQLPIWIIWVISMTFLFASSFFILSGTLSLFLKKQRLRLWGLIFSCGKTFTFFSIFSSNVQDFSIPYLDFSLSLLIIFSLALAKAIVKKRFFYLWICMGIFLSFFGGTLWLLKIPKFPYFNHNDLFHVLQTIGVFFTYLGYKHWIQRG